MGITNRITNLFKRKPREPEFNKVCFNKYEDFYGNFSIFYPKDWRYDPSVIVDNGAYAIVFHSKRSRTQFRLGVETVLPLKFDFRKYAKKEIESSSSGMIATAKSTKFREYPCFTAIYEYESDGKKFLGKRLIFYTENRIFSIFYTYPQEEDCLEAVFDYMKDSVTINPAKTKIFKRPCL